MLGFTFEKKMYSFVRISSFTYIYSKDSDEMPHYAVFHQGLHCFYKYLFKDIPYTKGFNMYIYEFHSF